MSRIKGLNDELTLKNKPISAAITVWKGEKKSDRQAGKSLNEKFRIEVPPRLKSLLKSALQAEERDGSLYVETITLVCAFEDEFKTFVSQMSAYNASRPILFCDRQTIHTKFIEQKDSFGGVYFQPIEVEEACPVAGTNFECPNKCARNGDFYFYIWELMILGYAEFARLRVHGVADNQNIASVIDEVKASVGAIKSSPFVNEETRGYILYQMSRRKVESKYPIKTKQGIRTDKRGTKEDWVIHLGLHPTWLDRYQNYLSAQKLLAVNLTPSTRLITQVYGAGLLESSDRDTPEILGQLTGSASESRRWAMDENKINELKVLWQTHGWTKSALEELLVSYFDISDRAQIMNLSEADFERLKVLSTDTNVKNDLLNTI
jgi:hypothetical protein